MAKDELRNAAAHRARRRRRRSMGWTWASTMLWLVTAGCRVERWSPTEAEGGRAAVAVPSASGFETASVQPPTAQAPPSARPPERSWARLEPEPSRGDAAAPAGNTEDERLSPEPLPAAPVPAPGVGGAAPPAGWALIAFAGGAAISEALASQLRAELGRGTPASAAARVVAALELLEATNAGRGAAVRLDGVTVECDALVLDDAGGMGRALAVRATLQPTAIAEALYRGGGRTMRGAATDDLAERLGLAQGSLQSAVAEAEYEAELSRSLHDGSPATRGALFSLYVEPERVARALREVSPASPPARRLPVFAWVQDADGRTGLAMSTGGTPLDAPGAPSALDDAETLPLLVEAGAAVVVGAAAEPCPGAGAAALARLRTDPSLLRAGRAVERRCPQARYLLVRSGRWYGNLDAEGLLVVGDLDAERGAHAAPESAPTAAPPPRGSVESPVPARGEGE